MLYRKKLGESLPPNQMEAARSKSGAVTAEVMFKSIMESTGIGKDGGQEDKLVQEDVS